MATNSYRVRQQAKNTCEPISCCASQNESFSHTRRMRAATREWTAGSVRTSKVLSTTPVIITYL
jgi:hypothetical protein